MERQGITGNRPANHLCLISILKNAIPSKSNPEEIWAYSKRVGRDLKSKNLAERYLIV